MGAMCIGLGIARDRQSIGVGLQAIAPSWRVTTLRRHPLRSR